jgi:hypothetical protein
MVLVRVLVVLGVLLAVASVIAGYVRYQALDTPTVEKTANELIDDDEIRNQVAATLVDQLFSNVDVQAGLEQRLSPEQQGLAAPLAAAMRELADRSARRLLAGPRFQALWESSIVRAHEQLVRLLDDELTNVSTQNGAVVLDLQPLVIQLGDQVAVFGALARRLPADTGQVQVLQADQLQTAQDLTELLNNLARFLWLVPLALFAIAIWLARGRRRTTLRMIAIGLTVAGLLVLLVRRVAGNYIVDHVVKNDAVRPAAGDAWSILTSLLADGGWTLVGLGVVALISVWLVGPSRSGTAARRGLAPFLARWEIAYGTAAVLLLLLVLWGPTVQTTRARLIVSVAILLGVGVALLRRQAAREFPDAATIGPGDALRGTFERMRGVGPPDTRLEELERLARLREQGVLSEAEVAAEKKRLLGSPA